PLTVSSGQGPTALEHRPACPNLPPVELTDVNLTLLNDPLPTVRFQGQGTSGLAGTLEWSGTFQRTSGDLILTLQTRGTDVGPALVQRLVAYAPRLATDPWQLQDKANFLEGKANLQPELR